MEPIKAKRLNVILNYVIYSVHTSSALVIAYTLIYFIPSFTHVYYGSLDLYIVMPKS